MIQFQENEQSDRKTGWNDRRMDGQTLLYRTFLASTGYPIKRLYKRRATQKSDVPIKIIKDDADIFADYLGETVTSAIKTTNFPF